MVLISRKVVTKCTWLCKVTLHKYFFTKIKFSKRCLSGFTHLGHWTLKENSQNPLHVRISLHKYLNLSLVVLTDGSTKPTEDYCIWLTTILQWDCGSFAMCPLGQAELHFPEFSWMLLVSMSPKRDSPVRFRWWK